MNYLRITVYDTDGNVIASRRVDDAELNAHYFLDVKGQPVGAVAVVARELHDDGSVTIDPAAIEREAVSGS